MKDGWEVKKLGDVCEIAPKKAVVKKTLTDEHLVSFVPMDHLGKLEIQFKAKEDRPLSNVYKSYTYFCDGDVIIAKITPCFENGKMGLVSGMTNGVGFGSSEFVPIRGQGRTLPNYLFYFLLRNDFRKNGARVMSGAVGHKRVPKDYLENLPIPLPPLHEQKRIVDVLDTAFEGLTRARENVEANLESARELFEAAREEYLDPTDKAGWAHHQLDSLITIKHGFAFKSAFFKEVGDYAVLTPGNYHETGGFRDRGEKQKYYTADFPEEFLLKKDQLLMAMTEQAPGLLGSSLLVPKDDRFLHNQRLGLLTPKDGVVWHPEYFSQAFNLKRFRKGLSDTCSGATVRHTSPKRILAETVPYSNDLNELANAAIFLSDLESQSDKIRSNYRTKLQDLDDLRQSLLQKAFAGELT